MRRRQSKRLVQQQRQHRRSTRSDDEGNTSDALLSDGDVGRMAPVTTRLHDASSPSPAKKARQGSRSTDGIGAGSIAHACLHARRRHAVQADAVMKALALPSSWCCSLCATTSSVYSCLKCGRTFCGPEDEDHAREHFLGDAKHFLFLEVNERLLLCLRCGTVGLDIRTCDDAPSLGIGVSSICSFLDDLQASRTIVPPDEHHATREGARRRFARRDALETAARAREVFLTRRCFTAWKDLVFPGRRVRRRRLVDLLQRDEVANAVAARDTDDCGDNGSSGEAEAGAHHGWKHHEATGLRSTAVRSKARPAAVIDVTSFMDITAQRRFQPQEASPLPVPEPCALEESSSLDRDAEACSSSASPVAGQMTPSTSAALRRSQARSLRRSRSSAVPFMSPVSSPRRAAVSANLALAAHKGLIPRTPARRTLKPCRASGVLRPGFCGLRNLGNTCYLSSVLQALSHTPIVLDYFSEQLLPEDKGVVMQHDGSVMWRQATVDCLSALAERVATEPEDVYLGVELHKLYRTLWSGNWSIVTPFSTLDALWRLFPQFRGYEQHDAHELLIALLDQVDVEARRVTALQCNLAISQVGTSVPMAMFQGTASHRITCRRCGHVSARQQGFLDLALPLSVASEARRRGRRGYGQRGTSALTCTLRECLKLYHQPDTIEGYRCDACGCESKARKQTLIHRLPDVICIVLKRFVLRSNGMGFTKNDAHVKFPLEGMDLSWLVTREADMCDDGSETEEDHDLASSCVYDLCAVVVHHGTTLTRGHYYTLAYNEEIEEWTELNDAKARIVEPDDVSSSQAYMLLYQRTTSTNVLGQTTWEPDGGRHSDNWILRSGSGWLIGGYPDNYVYDGEGVATMKNVNMLFEVDSEANTASGRLSFALDDDASLVPRNGQSIGGDGISFEFRLDSVEEQQPWQQGGAATYVVVNGPSGQLSPALPQSNALLVVAGRGRLLQKMGDTLFLLYEMNYNIVYGPRVRDKDTRQVYADADETRLFDPNNPSAGFVAQPDELSVTFTCFTDEVDGANAPPFLAAVRAEFFNIKESRDESSKIVRSLAIGAAFVGFLFVCVAVIGGLWLRKRKKDNQFADDEPFLPDARDSADSTL